MNTKLFVLPTLCLGGAALLLAPPRSSGAFTKLGGFLGDTQRDVRLFDNFLDAQANANITPAAQFPGYTGAELAIWKGIVEWGSMLHGDGTGDPLTNPLGNGGANFDAFWAGNASGIGTTNTNIASSLASCGGGGTLAYCETPISDGWRIRFCDEWTWDDGPGAISNRWDIQGVMCHEYGHALGLGHSGVGSATMAPSGSPGQTTIRSIAADDSSGIQCIYGVASGTKPTITATVADSGAGTITIHGTNFSATGNEVWFTNGVVTATGIDPIVRVTGVSSNGTEITVTIPSTDPLAGPGDVMVRKSGGGNAGLSNAFPTDLEGTFGTPPDIHPNITSVTPSTIDALMPGTDQSILLTGTNFLLTTDVLIDGSPIDPSRYTIFDDNTIALDMPQVATLGAHNLGVTDGGTPDTFGVTIVVPDTPQLQMGTGDDLNVVDRDNGLPLILSGDVGSTHYLYGSVSNLPSSNTWVSLDIGNNFTQLISGGSYTIPASGWLPLVIPTSGLPDPGPGPGMTLYAQTFQFGPKPFPDSNLQSMVLVQ